MPRLQRLFFAVCSLVLLLSTPAVASSFGDLNCDEDVNVVDVQLSIIVALELPISEDMDADQNGTPDACLGEVICGAGTILQAGACVALVTQADVDAAYDSGYSDGEDNADNSAYWQGYVEGEDVGYMGGYWDGEAAGIDVGYELGVTDGYDIGYNAGYWEGHSAGYFSGYEYGETNGYADGESDGYTEGFNAGVASVDITSDNQGLYDEGYESGACDLSQTTLIGADLSGADLVNADLTGAILFQTNLTQVNLISADLSEANLVGANLQETDLFEANLDGANLTGVVWDTTICPDKTDSGDNGGTCCNNLNGAVPAAGCD